MPFNRKKPLYIVIMAVLLAMVTVFYSARAFSIQIVTAEEYSSAAIGITTRKSVIKAARGEIIDCNGKKIAANRDGYDIVLNSAYIERETLNALILELMNICTENNTAWVDELPMKTDGDYGFTEDSASKISKLVGILKLADYATAQNCFDAMVEKYSLEAYSPDIQRKIMGVRYSMDLGAFSISAPYTFAEDVPSAVMLKVTEFSHILKGVTVEISPYREYTVTNLAPHIIGTTGPIYENEWEKYKALGYSYNDKVGKSGIELYAEEYLHGIDGEMTYKIDADGNIVSAEVTKAPVQGKTVKLTLDKNLQISAQNVLADTINDLKSKNSTVTGGTAVVMNVKTGAVLASANYPSYDMETYKKNYDALLSDSNKPLLDRAFQGIYPIGSTIKPAVAVAAMTEGKYNYGETVFCKQTYDYFSDYKPSCMHYHGNIQLKRALALSCNYFFFEMGKRLGVVKMDEYLKDFGLGVKTGVEINDSSGLLTEFESDSGNTLQVAIGQLNAFTPLQLACYTSTLANGGTRYKATLIDSVASYDNRETFVKNEPVVQSTLTIRPDILNAVNEGLLSVTEDGTGRGAFGDYSIKVGGKTGTAQTNSGNDHSVFIAFAPFDSPEIAVVVVLEHANSTISVTTVARKIMDSYFFTPKEQADPYITPFTVLE